MTTPAAEAQAAADTATQLLRVYARGSNQERYTSAADVVRRLPEYVALLAEASQRETCRLSPEATGESTWYPDCPCWPCRVHYTLWPTGRETER